MDQVKIGNFILECRKAKGLTQQELADKLGITAKAVSKWECGKGLPDVSLYETICEELGITLNEFFAGEHIESNQIVAQSDKNLENILKDYYKLKKKDNIIFSILVILLALIITYFIKPLLVIGLLWVVETFQAETIVRNDINQYDIDYYMETYGGDLDSRLSIFPNEVQEDMDVLAYESSFQIGLFDTYGYLVFDYALEEAAFEEELRRLSSLEIEITDYTGESYINKVIYDETSYLYPAYITMDGYRSTYEYALIDTENHRIICVYLTYTAPSEFAYKDFLKRDLTSYESTDSITAYSMYSHSFDGGNSYVEYDDYIE